MRATWVAALLLGACASTPPPDPVAPSSHTTTTQTTKPEKRRMVVTETHVEILDPIRFLTGSVTIDPRSTPSLDAIASTLTGNPSIKLVAVHAYGTDALSQFQARIGADRAQAIVDQLVARGVSPGRLVAQGEATPPPGWPSVPQFEILKRD